MKNTSRARILSNNQLAMLILASAIAVPAMGQQTQPADTTQNPPPAAAAQSSSTPPPAATTTKAPTDQREGFWGRVNPMARKKWVKKRIDPMNDRLSELDQVNAKNANDIKDVDSRAQAGISKAQAAADGANQTASAANDAAHKAGDTAQGASGHVDKINTTVSGLDQYKQISDVEVPFRGGNPMLSKDAKSKLDEMATSLAGHQGYIIEIEAHSPGAGSVGISNSQREAEAVKRYLVAEHQIPVYRMHSVALGNAKVVEATDQTATSAPADTTAKPAPAHKARIQSSVHIRLMENSLAAQDTTSPHGMASSTGAERP